jgi:hypothetical protein
LPFPADLPPNGFVGTGLQTQGLDIDMAHCIGNNPDREKVRGHGDHQAHATLGGPQTLRGQQRHRVGLFVSGHVQVIATGASVAGSMMFRNPQLNTEYKLLIKDSPNFIGVGKGEEALRLRLGQFLSALH